MTTAQKTRDKRAAAIVDHIRASRLPPITVLRILENTCSDPQKLDFAPHLVTALREAQMWPSLQRADIDETGK